ncbi:unnamed protein product [Ectocarpus sp. 4 AP-2014]
MFGMCRSLAEPKSGRAEVWPSRSLAEFFACLVSFEPVSMSCGQTQQEEALLEALRRAQMTLRHAHGRLSSHVHHSVRLQVRVRPRCALAMVWMEMLSFPPTTCFVSKRGAKSA